MTRLETKRMILRPLDITDAEAMYRNWASDLKVAQFISHGFCNSVEAAQQRINQWLDNFSKLPAGSAWHIFAMQLKSGGELIGTIDYYENNRDAHAAEIGYEIGSAWWGNGYATEALRAVINHCFEEVGLKRLWADCNSLNMASAKVMLKSGMLHEGTFRQCSMRNGVLVDRLCYAILKQDWENQNT